MKTPSNKKRILVTWDGNGLVWSHRPAWMDVYGEIARLDTSLRLNHCDLCLIYPHVFDTLHNSMHGVLGRERELGFLVEVCAQDIALWN
jgi:hypothetical protein